VNGESLIFGGAVASFVVGMGLSVALVSMQRRLCALKTQRDQARKELAASRRHEGDALADLHEAKRRATFAENLLADLQKLRGFGHVNLAYPADALPDLPTAPLEDDPWVAEMRQRWLFDNTSEQ
jgi:hypothetical protein